MGCVALQWFLFVYLLLEHVEPQHELTLTFLKKEVAFVHLLLITAAFVLVNKIDLSQIGLLDSNV